MAGGRTLSSELAFSPSRLMTHAFSSNSEFFTPNFFVEKLAGYAIQIFTYLILQVLFLKA
jgi:hypothetical protein